MCKNNSRPLIVDSRSFIIVAAGFNHELSNFSYFDKYFQFFMKLLSPAISRLARFRLSTIEQWINDPISAQRHVLQHLVTSAQNTEYGRKYGFNKTFTTKAFKQAVPISEYDDIKPYIDRMMAGEENILWNTPIEWFAKSSGTTSPITTNTSSKPAPSQAAVPSGGSDQRFLSCDGLIRESSDRPPHTARPRSG